MKQKRINNFEEMMKKRKDKIETKHDKIDKQVNKMNQEKNKKREDLIPKRTQDLIKIYNHRNQLDIFKLEQEKKLLELKTVNDDKEKRLIERMIKMQQRRRATQIIN